jgi:hypothetical protein
VKGWWFSPVSSINKTDSHDITEKLLKVALNTINQTRQQMTVLYDGSAKFDGNFMLIEHDFYRK